MSAQTSMPGNAETLTTAAASAASVAQRAVSLSPYQRAWARFKRNRLGYVSLWIFLAMLALSTVAEIVSNDKPLIAKINGQTWFPMLSNPNEKALGGDFVTATDWKDPFVADLLKKSENWSFGAINPHSAQSTDYFSKTVSPAPPTTTNWLGTDSNGRDMVARLIYGFRVSIWFAIALTMVGTFIGVVMGAIMGYFGGWVDLGMQRIVEIWGAVPELYFLIIFAAIFEPSIGLLLILLALWSWLGLSDYVRAEFLRNRSLEYVKAARALGLSNMQIIRRHVLPNSLTPVITFIPFRMSAAILALTSLDFLGLGVPASVPSLGQLLLQGKANLDSWWIIFPTFLLLTITMLLLTFIGDALRDAFDTRKS